LKRNLCLTAILGCGISACTPIGPDYRTPGIEVPASYVDGSSGALENAATRAWWSALGDRTLDDIVAIGLRQNLDVRAATERISAARARLARTGVPAQIGGDLSLNARRGEVENAGVENESFGAADASFVFDLFGRFARERQAAAADLEAVQFDAGTVRLAYLAEVIDAYNQARYFQAAAAITRDSIAGRRQTLDLVERRVEVGEATALEQAQARSLLATAEASLPILIGRYEENVFRIATLLGEPGATIKARLDRGGPQPRPRGQPDIGVPADVLRNRPDVRAAERSLASATAAIGIAEAELYPSLALSGAVTAGDRESWSFGPFLTLPVFNQPTLRANRRIAQSTAREAELIWRSSVLTAVEETQAALSLSRQWARQTAAFQRAVDAATDLRDLSREAYDAGQATVLDLIDAERGIADNRLSLAGSLRNWTSSYVQLQVGAGKGWLVGVEEFYVISDASSGR